MSLSVLIKKLRFKNKITEEECDELLKKLKGHDREIYNKAIEDFKVEIYNKLFNGVTTFTSIFSIYEIAEELKKGNDNDTLEKSMRFKKVKDEFLELKKGTE